MGGRHGRRRAPAASSLTGIGATAQLDFGTIMNTARKTTPEQWARAWISSVANGANTMSARSVATIEKRGGGLKKVASVAKQQAVHLVLLEDDKGVRQVAASKKPFKVLA